MADPNITSQPGGDSPAEPGADYGAELDHARAELADMETRLRAILDTAVDGIITIDESGTMESVNSAVENMFGYAADELVGKNVSMLMLDADCDRHDGYIRNYLDTGRKKIIGIGREVDGRHRDGSRIPLDLAVSEMRVHGRRLFMGIVRDISARRRAEAEARQRLDELARAARLSSLGELTGVVAHEVNQPLAAIVSFAEACLRMLRADDPPTDKLQNALEQIVGQGQRAGEIIRRLRRMARKGDDVREPVDLNALVRDVLELLGNELRLRDIELELELDEALPSVRCNRIQIEQVVINLLRNAQEAVEHHPPGERLIGLRTTACEGGGVELVIENRGDGIDRADAERIFETFFTTKPEGIGMGLSVSRSIVEAHGGRLWAEAREEGAVFHVLLDAEGEA